MKAIAVLVILLIFKTTLFAQISFNNTKTEGYRGIWFELNQKYPFGDKYSGGLGTYTADHIPMAVYAPEVGKTFFVYGGTTGEKEKHLLDMIGCYDHRKNVVEKPTVVYDKQTVNDPHDNPSLLIDKKGYLWVFVSGRAKLRPGFKMRSSKPWSIEKFEQVTSEEMTYPQPWLLDQGIIHLFTKYTGVRELYYETSPDGVTWTEDKKLAGIRAEGDKLGGHYQISWHTGNKVGTFFNRHPNGNVDKRTDMYYLQTTDFGKSWTTVEGKTVETPLTTVKNPAMVHDYQSEGKNVYLMDMDFDKSGFPVCLYLTSKGHEPGPGNSPRQWKVTKWTGKEWITTVVGESDHNYDMGSLYLLKDTWLVIGPLVNGPQVWGAGGEVVMMESADEGKTWSLKSQVTFNSTLNNSYMRRPLNAHDPFFFFWADGNPDQFSISRLHFGDAQGNVYRMPYTMKGQQQKPETIYPCRKP